MENHSLGDGLAWALRREMPGVASLVDAFGRMPVVFSAGGGAWTPATMRAMASLGMRIYLGNVPLAGRGWYCGMLTVPIHLLIEPYVDNDLSPTGGSRFREAVERYGAASGPGAVLGIMTHPTRLVTTDYWDKPFYDNADPPLSTLPPPPLRSDAQVRQIKDRVRRWLDWMQESGMRFIDFSTYYLEHAGEPRDLSALLRECGLRPDAAGDLPVHNPGQARHAVPAPDAVKRYDWQLFPSGFTGVRLVEQAKSLLWTYAPGS